MATLLIPILAIKYNRSDNAVNLLTVHENRF